MQRQWGAGMQWSENSRRQAEYITNRSGAAFGEASSTGSRVWARPVSASMIQNV